MLKTLPSNACLSCNEATQSASFFLQQSPKLGKRPFPVPRSLSFGTDSVYMSLRPDLTASQDCNRMTIHSQAPTVMCAVWPRAATVDHAVPLLTAERLSSLNLQCTIIAFPSAFTSTVSFVEESNVCVCSYMWSWKPESLSKFVHRYAQYIPAPKIPAAIPIAACPTALPSVALCWKQIHESSKAVTTPHMKIVPTAFLWPVYSRTSTPTPEPRFRAPTKETKGSAGDVDVVAGIPRPSLKACGLTMLNMPPLRVRIPIPAERNGRLR